MVAGHVLGGRRVVSGAALLPRGAARLPALDVAAQAVAAHVGAVADVPDFGGMHTALHHGELQA